MPVRKKLTAHIVPFLAFAALLLLNSALRKIDNQLWLTLPEYWTYPVQTFLCGALLISFRPAYDLGWPRKIGFAVLVAIVVFVIWISPQAILGFPRRTVGFNPFLLFNQSSPLYWIELILRFARLVVVVPFVEEIFWRGFLLRYLIDENFERIGIGAFSWFSFVVVTIGFALSHSPADWPVAVVAGGLYNIVAYRTKSLASCILAHAFTNLLLGCWIMQTKQWGFW
ncbi:MAG: CAAX prenyl protease-related protein [Chthoniobacterales bacterium]